MNLKNWTVKNTAEIQLETPVPLTAQVFNV